jgi:hypothetical protein
MRAETKTVVRSRRINNQTALMFVKSNGLNMAKTRNGILYTAAAITAISGPVPALGLFKDIKADRYRVELSYLPSLQKPADQHIIYGISFTDGNQSTQVRFVSEYATANWSVYLPSTNFEIVIKSYGGKVDALGIQPGDGQLLVRVSTIVQQDS